VNTWPQEGAWQNKNYKCMHHFWIRNIFLPHAESKHYFLHSGIRIYDFTVWIFPLGMTQHKCIMQMHCSLFHDFIPLIMYHSLNAINFQLSLYNSHPNIGFWTAPSEFHSQTRELNNNEISTLDYSRRCAICHIQIQFCYLSPQYFFYK